MRRGRFISLEGGEGTGKSTQVDLLCAYLRERVNEVVATREPGGAPGAEEIRHLLVAGAIDRWQPLSEALLHYAARCEHRAHTIKPALAAGRWVVSDRFADSTLAYQGHGHRLGADRIAALQHVVLGDFAPDLTVILDLAVEEGLRRAASRESPSGHRAADRYERMTLDFHERVRQGFLGIAAAEPERCAVIDATPAADLVHERIIAVLDERLMS